MSSATPSGTEEVPETRQAGSWTRACCSQCCCLRDGAVAATASATSCRARLGSTASTAAMITSRSTSTGLVLTGVQRGRAGAPGHARPQPAHAWTGGLLAAGGLADLPRLGDDLDEVLRAAP
jgi:hypothetical protein